MNDRGRAAERTSGSRDRFAGRAAIVTGAASGIGLAIAVELAKGGSAVVTADVRERPAVLTEVQQYGGRIVHTEADVTKSADLDRLVQVCLREFGGLDMLFNNAGIAPPGSVDELAEEDWARILSVDLTAVYLGSRAVLPHMVGQRRGVIVNTASTLGLIAQPKMAAYTAAKHGVVGLTRQIAIDYARFGIRCNCVCPGPTRTPNIDRIYGQPEALTPRGRYLLETVPLGRMAWPREIATAAAFLASDDASFITGAALVVDGGHSIHTGPVWGEDQFTNRTG